MQVNITIPANTRATVTLPGALVEKITESGIPLLKAEGMTSTAQVGKDTQVELGSGAYHFEYPTLNGN
jgi:alpha-L-rhamnosidase